MAVFHPYEITCTCGHPFTVHLADSINIKRSPNIREIILSGDFHRVTCPACHATFTVEKPFYYTDGPRNALFHVLPSNERHNWKTASSRLTKTATVIPAFMMPPEHRTLRVVYGIDELREKLIAQDAGYDDRVVELFKVLVLYEHPILLRRPRLRLVLHSVSATGLEFLAAYEHDAHRFRATLTRRVANDLAAHPEKLKSWTRKAHKTSLFELPDHWVNIWRWSPQPTALERLQSFAGEARAGHRIDTASVAFRQMLKGVPRGAHLPAWAKQDLRAIFEYAKRKKLQTLEDQLFEIRFGFELDDDWAKNNDPEDIDTLWQLLRDLPDTNVEGNSKIHELILKEGTASGTYDPSSHDITIGSGEFANRERFQDVVRHEVGHAVHEQHEEKVNAWLRKRYGWTILDNTAAEIERWMDMVGGCSRLTAKQRREVREALRSAIGKGSSWTPGPAPVFPAGHPWNAPDFGPRLAYENTGAYWFRNFKNWHRANGKAFYLNYWYQTFVAVDVSALDVVAQMPDSYAAMSHFEFFAELYALYYNVEDPKRAAIPKDVAAWFETNIGAPESEAAEAKPKRRWETVVRPKKKHPK